jgi:hypothetical protein
MTIQVIRFLNVIMVALVAGSIFGIWIGFNPKNLSVTSYIEQQQQAIKSLNTLMPLLGLITIILTIIAAFLQKNEKTVFLLLLIGAVLLIISGLITRFGNQPINSIVMNWNIKSPPTDWMELRDKWWILHILRTVSALIALSLIAWASTIKTSTDILAN